MNDLPTTFPELFAELEARGWNIKFSSRTEQGQRLYTARLYREDGLHGGRRHTHTNPAQALRDALDSAVTLRRQATRRRNRNARRAAAIDSASAGNS